MAGAAVAVAAWDAFRARVQFPEAVGDALSDAQSCAELAAKQEIHRASSSPAYIGHCFGGSDVTWSTDTELTCEHGQGLSCSDTHGGYFLSRTGFVPLPSQLRAQYRCGHVNLGPGMSLATRLCYSRRVLPPPAAVGGPLHETKVGPAGDSDPFEFAWDHVAPPRPGHRPDLHGRIFLPVGTSLDRAGAGAALWDGGLDNEIMLGETALARGPWTQCMEPAVAGGAAAGPPLRVVLVGLPSCLRGLTVKPFAEVVARLSVTTKGGALMRVIINGFSQACNRRLISGVAHFDAALSALLSMPSEFEAPAVPADIGATLLALLDELGVTVDEDTRGVLDLPEAVGAAPR